MRSRRLPALAFVGALLGAASAVHAQVLPHPITVDHLANGLTVVTVPFDSPGIAAYYTLVRTGARDEVEHGHSGFAHLFEHMMFRGTRTHGAEAYEHLMQSLGADNNAFTTEDYTLFTVTIPSASLATLIPIEADRFQHLAFTNPVFQTETRAVLGEYNKNSASPLQQMWENLSELAFTQHTYGHTTIGYLADVLAMPHEYAYAQHFFQRFYRPDNCTVIVAGDVDHDAVLAQIHREYDGWRGHRAATSPPLEPEQTEPRTRALAWEGSTPPRMLIGYRIPAFDVTASDSAALQVVHALAFSESSNLYQRLVVHDQKLLGLESWRGDFHRDPQLFVVEARLAEGTSFDEVESAITEELAHIGRGETPHDRIDAVISNLRYAQPMQVQTPSDAATIVGGFMALTGDPATLDQYQRRLASVIPDDVTRVTRTYLTPARRNTLTLTEAAHAAAGAIRVGPDMSSRPRASAAPAPHAARRAGGGR